MLFIFVPALMEFHGIPRISVDFKSQSTICMNLSIYSVKFVRIKSKITGLAEVESASFFLVCQSTNFPLRISPVISKFFLSPLLAD